MPAVVRSDPHPFPPAHPARKEERGATLSGRREMNILTGVDRALCGDYMRQKKHRTWLQNLNITDSLAYMLMKRRVKCMWTLKFTWKQRSQTFDVGYLRWEPKKCVCKVNSMNSSLVYLKSHSEICLTIETWQPVKINRSSIYINTNCSQTILCKQFTAFEKSKAFVLILVMLHP